MNDPSTHTAHRLLTGRYALELQLGSGGAGTVWRAHDQLLDRVVAVKLLHDEVAEDPPTAARFRAEASMAAKLTHPNAVIVYDIGRDAGHDYLVMEYVEGGTLADVLVGEPLPAGVVAGLGAQVGRALGAAHERRLVHRDVKPANVLITRDGIAKVADFGIAQALGATSSRLTLPGQVMGTARYLAPEQLRGEPVDARADVYALGVLLHEALTGDIPFGEGTMSEVASRRLVASLPRVSERRSDVPYALDDAIVRATQLEPEDRFASGTDFAAELARAATPGSGRALAIRLARRIARPPAAPRDPAAVTADLALDAGGATRDASAPQGRDDPTTVMGAGGAPPAARGAPPAARGTPPTPRAAPGDPPEASAPAGASHATGDELDRSGEPAPSGHERDGSGVVDAEPSATHLVGASGSSGRHPADGALTADSVSGPADGSGSTAASGPVGEDRPAPAHGGSRTRGRPLVLAMGLVVAVLVGGAAVVAGMDRDRGVVTAVDDDRADGLDGSVEADPEEPEDAEETEEELLPAALADVVDARDHDPFGSGEEHRADVSNAFDGDPATSWQTQGYRGSPELGGLKPGVGIWLDLGETREVTEVEVAMGTAGASFTLYTGSAPPGSGAAPDSWGREVATVQNADSLYELTLDEPVEGRVWMLWFTSLPQDGSLYRATVSDVRLLGS